MKAQKIIKTCMMVRLRNIITITFLVTSANNALSVNQEIITDDGREVLLKDDGSWEFRSNDRLANTAEGRRVRLKQDGSWQYIGNAAVVTKKQVRTTDLDVKLQKVVIETYEKKVQKNKRIRTQTVFYLNLELSPLAKNNVSIKESDTSNIKVKDDTGTDYSVLSILPSPATIEPGSNTIMTVRVEKSPLAWGSAKLMEVEFSPDIFGIQEIITFSQKIDDFEEKDVDGFN